MRFFKNNTPMHSSNICSVYVLKENKIHRGITENSSVQTTINNQAKPPKSPFFKKSPKFQFLRFFKNNTPKNRSNICSFHLPKENEIHRRIIEQSSVQSSAPRCQQADRWTWFIGLIIPLNV